MKYILKDMFIACFITFILTYFFFSIYELSIDIREWEIIIRQNFAIVNLTMNFLYLFVIVLGKEH